MKNQFMLMALELAKKGEGKVAPNPLVGAVIVKDNKVISSGYHEKYGEFHAERNAILNAKQSLKGCEMYVTLEPCSHYGKTPPCTEIIIESGISKVYIGCLDSNPLVAGRGVKILKDAGIKVEFGILEAECKAINEIFFHYIRNKTPYVALKFAMSVDGKMASKTYKSKWITGENSRAEVQSLRNKFSGILVGINTILKDNPTLNCRMENGVDPVRIILDKSLQIPIDSKIVDTANTIKTIIFTVSRDLDKISELSRKGLLIERVNLINGNFDLNLILEILGDYKISSVLVEGGGNTNSLFIENNKIQEIYAFIGNKLIGGNAVTPYMGSGVDDLSESLELSIKDVKKFADDVLINYKVM